MSFSLSISKTNLKTPVESTIKTLRSYDYVTQYSHLNTSVSLCYQTLSL